MKKHVQLLFFSSFLTLKVLFAQNTNKLELGLELGPSISSLRGNEILDQFHSPKITLSSAIFIQYHFKKGFGLVTDLAYEHKGSKIKRHEIYDDMGNIIGTSQGRTDFYYLTLPLKVLRKKTSSFHK